MRIAVLGGGVIGVTSAYYLAEKGYDVTVFDRQSGPALETSFANAGEISPGYSAPWASPGVPAKLLRWLTMQHSPLVVRPRLDPAMWRWLATLLRNCTAARYALNKSRMVPLAEYSRDKLVELRQATEIDYDARSQGTLQLFRTQAAVDAVGPDIDVLKAYGVPFELLNRAGCVADEPALGRVSEKVAGGLRLPNDETGDCHKFTTELVKHLAGKVRFQFGMSVTRIVTENNRVTGIETAAGPFAADCLVVALGSYSTGILRQLGLKIPVYPVKGYSLTFPMTDPSAAPVSTVIDDTYKIATTRLGDRIRVGGTVELSGYNTDLPLARRGALEHSVRDLFGASGPIEKAKFWSGLRPMTPDGPPIIGSTPIAGLYTNTGHGTFGWTMACGSGAVLADIIAGQEPDIDAKYLAITRYA